MTLYELKALVDEAVEEQGLGSKIVAFGDCNGLFKAGSAGLEGVESLDEYHMEPCPLGDGEVVWVVGE